MSKQISALVKGVVKMKEYLYTYALSRADMKKIVNKHNPITVVVLLAVALLIVSIPEKQQFSISDYVYNFTIIGASVIAINIIIAALVSQFTGKKIHEIVLGLLHMTAAAFIINSIILMALYVIGIPFGLSNILWAAAATLLSTYYFIVLLAVCSGSMVDEEGKIKVYIVEIAALVLWYLFTFYVLSLTI